MIPGLNDPELLGLAERAAKNGAQAICYQIVRLNGDVGPIFEDWIRKALPDRAERTLNRIKDCHGGQLNDSRSGIRMKGEGKIADIIAQQYQLAKKLYFKDQKMPAYNLELHEQFKTGQLSLF